MDRLLSEPAQETIMTENNETTETTKQPEREYARSWKSAQRLYDHTTKDFYPNPDAHPEIKQGTDGNFYTANGTPLKLKDVPEYIQEQGKRPINKINIAAFETDKERNLAEAMVDAGVTKPKRAMRTDQTV
jgi:hypothetical protein